MLRIDNPTSEQFEMIEKYIIARIKAIDLEKSKSNISKNAI